MALSARFAKGGRTSGGEEVCETAMPVPLYYVDAAFDGEFLLFFFFSSSFSLVVILSFFLELASSTRKQRCLLW